MRGHPGEGLRPLQRLRSGADFRRVLQRGLRLDGPLFALVAAANDRGYDRLGLAASRKVGAAVQRNRARRLLRETFRRNLRGGGGGLDLVLLAKPEIVTRTQQEVEREYRDRLRRLRARRGSGARGPNAAAGD